MLWAPGWLTVTPCFKPTLWFGDHVGARGVDFFSLGGLLPHFRSCDDTREFLLSNFQIVARIYMKE